MALGDILSQTGLDEQLGVSKQAASNASGKELNISDFDSFGGDVTSGKHTEIAKKKIPADTEWAWGKGAAKFQRNQGYLYVDLQNGTPAAVEGIIRFLTESSTTRDQTFVEDFDTERLDASKTQTDNMVPFPEQNVLATEDSYLVITMDPNSTDTISSANSDVIIPATEYDVSGGN